jgi:hypothetical protein
MKYIKLFDDFNTDEFYTKNNINPEELDYLGDGDYGEAFSIGNTGRVLKITSSYSEYEIAKELIGKAKEYSSFVEFYDATEINSRYYIVEEEVDTDSSIEDLYYDLSNMLEEQGLPIQYLDNLDEENLDISPKLRKFMNEISDINHDYRGLGIEASDLRPENLGYDKNGKLKAFDIEDKRRNKYKKHFEDYKDYIASGTYNDVHEIDNDWVLKTPIKFKNHSKEMKQEFEGEGGVLRYFKYQILLMKENPDIFPKVKMLSKNKAAIERCDTQKALEYIKENLMDDHICKQFYDLILLIRDKLENPDLHIENIGVDKSGKLKLIDF